MQPKSIDCKRICIILCMFCYIVFMLFCEVWCYNEYKIMKEVHRVLRPNGRWIVDAPSYKRRKLTNCKSDNWHGGSSMSIADVKQLVLNRFEVKSVHGIMMFPVHRIPQTMRKLLCNLDYRLSQLAPLKEYSSYLIYERWKF